MMYHQLSGCGNFGDQRRSGRQSWCQFKKNAKKHFFQPRSMSTPGSSGSPISHCTGSMKGQWGRMVLVAGREVCKRCPGTCDLARASSWSGRIAVSCFASCSELIMVSVGGLCCQKHDYIHTFVYAHTHVCAFLTGWWAQLENLI